MGVGLWDDILITYLKIPEINSQHVPLVSVYAVSWIWLL